MGGLKTTEVHIHSLLTTVHIHRGGRRGHAVRPTSVGGIAFAGRVHGSCAVLYPRVSPIRFRLLRPTFHTTKCGVSILPGSGGRTISVKLGCMGGSTYCPSLVIINRVVSTLLSKGCSLGRATIVVARANNNYHTSGCVKFVHHTLGGTNVRRIPMVSLGLDKLRSGPKFGLSPTLILHKVCTTMFKSVFVGYICHVHPCRTMPKAASGVRHG